MNWNLIRDKLMPSSLKKKKEEVTITKELDHLLYEFSLDTKTHRLDYQCIQSIVLTNPWVLVKKPSFFCQNDESDDTLFNISFFVLNKEEGQRIEKTILENTLLKLS